MGRERAGNGQGTGREGALKSPQGREHESGKPDPIIPRMKVKSLATKRGKIS